MIARTVLYFPGVADANRRVRRVVIGGAKRDRTADLLNAIQALSQLSYSPFRELTRLRYHSFWQPVKYIHWFFIFEQGMRCQFNCLLVECNIFLYSR